MWRTTRDTTRMGGRRDKDEVDHVGEATMDKKPLSIVVIDSTIW